ncbi:carboxylesterase/lipase family protein [Amycolatopsis viridis]|uniref:Carboxylic ester hydrolase n=1 Tax=Amycolatopsis viridis TaxID=185678 RepID=A0ABX0SW99_9PSEU|nr:carboxylesterase family protein [Amycolatopsis viridis]NIH80197.1 para-nitrobenzyl esterase [Amycolatopsis viridis]
MDTVVAAGGGKLRGFVTRDGLAEFRGVPFARAPRFAPPEPVEPWTGVRDATRHGPVSPQPPVRPDGALGVPADLPEQDEECLNLTVVTPAADDRKRPVMVWLHGGAYVTGANSFGFYGGHRLAAEGDVVFVAPNYRLGALGYLHLPGVSPGNLGLLDQLAALRWVRDNAAAFGGDPDDVTVFGQSAGAHSIACLMALPQARGLFRRAILQSAPLGLRLAGARTAARTARLFTAALGTDPRTAPVAEILRAQVATVVRAAGPGGLYSVPPFCPVADAPPLPSVAHWLSQRARFAPEVDVLIGTTAAEMNSFLTGKPGIAQLDRFPVTARAVAAVKAGVTRWMFAGPSRAFADQLAARGGRVYSYVFDWAAPESVFGAGHCIELPFLLGDEAAWRDAPMLAGAEWSTVTETGRTLRAAWLSFARTGTPEPGWPRHAPRRAPHRLP